MRRYRTEVVIPADREIVLQLPQDLPEGRAILVIQVEEAPSSLDPSVQGDDELGELLSRDRHDIEWWDEFDDEPVLGTSLS